jgi:4-carboxymuconolactone decarboxylase
MADLPRTYRNFQKAHKEVADAHDLLGKAAAQSGPLDAKTMELVRLGIAVGGLREGAVHSHTRRALEAGATPSEIRQALVLAVTTLGFPAMMSALTWAEDVLSQKKRGVARKKQ